jgi:Outer membrane protein beta-barrel domain
VFRLAVTLTLSVICASGQARYFVATLGGVSTLSADAETQLGTTNSVALYKPENGGAVNIAGGLHLKDWLSVQGNYLWNANRVTLMQVSDRAFFEQERCASQHAAVADLLLYFRNRMSWVRPYLSAGAGFVRVSDTLTDRLRGDLSPPPRVSQENGLLRVAVGIDIMHSSRWGFRYSFSESISGNPYSAVLQPRGKRNLANFQNLFGFVRYF